MSDEIFNKRIIEAKAVTFNSFRSDVIKYESLLRVLISNLIKADKPTSKIKPGMLAQ